MLSKLPLIASITCAILLPVQVKALDNEPVLSKVVIIDNSVLGLEGKNLSPDCQVFLNPADDTVPIKQLNLLNSNEDWLEAELPEASIAVGTVGITCLSGSTQYLSMPLYAQTQPTQTANATPLNDTSSSSAPTDESPLLPLSTQSNSAIPSSVLPSTASSNNEGYGRSIERNNPVVTPVPVTSSIPSIPPTSSGSEELISISMQALPSSAEIMQLPGCTNPNINTTDNGYGNGADAGGDYLDTDTSTYTVTLPVYESNHVFWTSKEAAPGQSVLFSGAFTSGQKNVRLALIPPGTINWQAIVEASSTIVTGTNIASTGFTFTIPPSFPAGVYAYRLEDELSQSVEGILNAPTIVLDSGG